MIARGIKISFWRHPFLWFKFRKFKQRVLEQYGHLTPDDLQEMADKCEYQIPVATYVGECEVK